jgi:uncharacterized protein YaiI (UPF0178 family)
MRIWVDADGCPGPIRQIVCRAAVRERIETTFVANRELRLEASPFLRSLRVPRGFDVADGRIAGLVAAGDLVVTADVPLAADVVARGAVALDPRGELYTADNVGERLAMRDAMEQLRDAGVRTGGPPAFGPADRAAFARRLDAILARRRRGVSGPA